MSVSAATPGRLSIDCGARAVLAALAALAGAAASGGCGFWFEDVTATPGIGPDAAPDALPGTPADACQFGRRQLIYASGRGPNGTSDLVLAERACQ